MGFAMEKEAEGNRKEPLKKLSQKEACGNPLKSIRNQDWLVKVNFFFG